MKRKELAAILIAGITFCALSPMKVNAASAEWKHQGTQWYYLNNSGEITKGWSKINNIWYYFNSDGSMKTGWLKEGNEWYYLKSNGEMATGWILSDNIWYYFNNSGLMQTGWLHLDNDGLIITDENSSEKNWYYLNSDGSMKTSWLKQGEKWYYLKANGQMATDWEYINCKWYHFLYGGKMDSNRWFCSEFPLHPRGMYGETYYLGKDGAWVENAENLLYKLEVEKKVYTTTDKEIKFTFTNNGDFETDIYPTGSLQAFGENGWYDIYTRDSRKANGNDDDRLKTIHIESNSKADCTVYVDYLQNGYLEPGKYRVVAQFGNKFVTSEFEVIGDKNDIHVNMDYEDIILYDDEDYKMGYTITNNRDKEITFGEEFKIQMFLDKKWKDTSLAPDAFIEIANVLKSKETQRYYINTKNMVNDMEEGTYRIVKTINGKEYYGEFNVKKNIYY